MHPTRLVGGLVSLAALLTLLLVPGALLAEPSATPSPAPAGALAPGATPSSSATPGAAPAAPSLTRAQKQAQRRAKRRARQRARWRRLRAEVLQVARRQLGVPYVWGGASRGGFDCSGLTLYAYGKIGRALPHGATDQARRGIRVSLRSLKPGDLVFWGGSGYYSHVALYAGSGRVIEAPSAGKVVSYDRLSGAAIARRLIGR
jgi:cell wall-associated NlpC family hydrolase